MKSFLLSILACSIALCSFSQKFSESFNPVIKEFPLGTKIIQHPDGNYLVHGDINYYNNSFSGSLIKVDPYGNLLQDFQKVDTDNSIGKVIILPSGKILIFGHFKYLNGKRVGRIALLNADGSVDPAFETDTHAKITNLVVQSTGKIIIVNYPEVQRLNSDGSRDYSFAPSSSPVYPYDALVGEDDKVYLVDNRTIRRILPDGQLDNSYGFTDDPSRSINKIVLQQDGKVIAAVTQIVSTSPFTMGFTLQRFTSSGQLDPAFHTDGANTSISELLIRKSGNIAITGYINSFGSAQGNAFELNPDGSTNRVLVTSDNNSNKTIYEDNQENLFVAGVFTTINNLSVKKIAKLRPSYDVDLSFKLPVSRTAGVGLDIPLVIQSTGKILVGGSPWYDGVGSDSSKIVRLLPNGLNDPSFQPSTRNSSSNFGQSVLTAIAVQQDDKIVVGGTNIFEAPSTALQRLLPDGQLDNSFQIGTGLSLSNNLMPGVRLIKIYNSKIFIIGNFDRFNGVECQSFIILDQNGKKIGPEINTLPANYYVQDMEFQLDGKILLLGTFSLSDTDNRKFLRLNLDGSIDDTFQLYTVDGNAMDIEVDANDNILVTGNSLDFDNYKILKRYKPDGEIDNTLDLGSGFGGEEVISGYFAKVLENNLIAIGGYFKSYRETNYPGVVLIDNDGAIVPFSNPFDSASYPIVGSYANKCLYLVGQFSKKGIEIRSAAKMVFPVEQNATDFKAEAISESTINLSWAGGFKGAEKIVVESSSLNNSSYQKVADLAPSANSYIVEGLNEVTPYHFRIAGVNEQYSSTWIDGKDTTKIAPQIPLPAAEITPGSFVARWEYEPGTDSCLLQVSHDNFTSFLSGYENLIVKSGSISVVGLEDGETYQYRVKRFKNNKSSEFSESVIVNIITEIEESPLKVKVYPNPVSDYLSIDLPENISNADLVIHSVAGAIVGKYSLTGKASSKVDLRDLPQGVFVLTISSKGMTKKYKLVRSE